MKDAEWWASDESRATGSRSALCTSRAMWMRQEYSQPQCRSSRRIDQAPASPSSQSMGNWDHMSSDNAATDGAAAAFTASVNSETIAPKRVSKAR